MIIDSNKIVRELPIPIIGSDNPLPVLDIFPKIKRTEPETNPKLDINFPSDLKEKYNKYKELENKLN